MQSRLRSAASSTGAVRQAAQGFGPRLKQRMLTRKDFSLLSPSDSERYPPRISMIHFPDLTPCPPLCDPEYASALAAPHLLYTVRSLIDKSREFT